MPNNMLLNGKCADRFKEWAFSNYHFSPYHLSNVLEPTLQYALIIEFFDSEGIFIEMNRTNAGSFWTSIGEIGFEFPSRTEALKAAIEKGNEIYNTKNQ